MPTTMPASPVTTSSRVRRRSAVDWLPVSSATRVPCSAPPSMPPSARSPSIAVIVRWCCAASTSVGASRAAWPPESTAASMARSATIGLAGADLALEQPVHRHVAAHLLAIVVPTSSCPAVRVNGSRASNASSRPPGPGRARRGRLPGCRPPPLRERHLQDEGLLVPQPPTGRLDLGHRVGGVDAAQRVGARHQPPPGADVGRQGVGHVVEHVEHPAHALGDGPGVQLPDGAVDRDERLAVTGVEVVEHRVAGVGQLEPLVVGADRAGEDAARTWAPAPSRGPTP